MRLLLLTVVALSLFTSVSSQAMTVSDVKVAEVVPATAERPELQLNGAALRELYLLIESYVGALYLETPSTSDAAILADTQTHKRMVFHIVMKRVGARRIANALQEALVVNISEQEHQELLQEIEQMLSYFQGKMHRGDEVWFDFIPGKGTRISINGEAKGIVPGDLYFHAMLSIWIGDSPVSRDFKDAVLGLNSEDKQAQVAGGN